MPSEIVVALCALAGTLFGSIGSIFVSSRLTNHRLEQLEKKVDKHNSLVERMVVVERDKETLFKYKDNHEQRIQKLEDAV